jgi:hypothetical protein
MDELKICLFLLFCTFKKSSEKSFAKNPVLQESNQRITVWIAFLHHSFRNPVRTEVPIFFFGYGFALLRVFLVSLSDKNEKFLKSFSTIFSPS